MSVSIWQRSNLLGTVQADVVVVGGGICGLAAALALERAGQRVALVERHRIGAGASGRNAGFLMRGSEENYAAACRRHGRDRARLLWTWSERNHARIRELGADRLSGYAPRPSCLLALERDERDELEESAQLLRDDGFDVAWLDSADDSAWLSGRALGGLVNPGDAVCDPVELLNLLASQLAGPVFEYQEVVAIEPDAGGLVVVGNEGRFHGQRVMVCTNAWASELLPELTGRVRPRRAQMLAMDAPQVRLDRAYYVNRGREYLRTADRGLVLVGGCRALGGSEEEACVDGISETVQQGIERFAAELLGRIGPVVARWSGIMGFSADGHPLIGPVDRPGWPGGAVWFCGGFTGHGMSLAVQCAEAAVDAMLGGTPTPFALSRPMPAWAQVA